MTVLILLEKDLKNVRNIYYITKDFCFYLFSLTCILTNVAGGNANAIFHSLFERDFWLDSNLHIAPKINNKVFYQASFKQGVNSFMMEVPIIYKPVHLLAEQINGLVSM